MVPVIPASRGSWVQRKMNVPCYPRKSESYHKQNTGYTCKELVLTSKSVNDLINEV